MSVFFNLSVCVFSGSSTSRNTLWLWVCVALQAQLYSRSCMFVLYPRLPEQAKWWAGSLFFLKQFLCVCDWYNLNLVEHLWNSQTLVLPKPTLVVADKLFQNHFCNLSNGGDAMPAVLTLPPGGRILHCGRWSRKFTSFSLCAQFLQSPPLLLMSLTQSLCEVQPVDLQF